MWKENLKASAMPAKWCLCNYDMNGTDPLDGRERHRVNTNLSRGEKRRYGANKKHWEWEKGQPRDTVVESQHA